MEISPHVQLLFWVLMLVLSAYYFSYGLIIFLKRRKEIKKFGEKTVAKVIDFKLSKDLDGVTYYTPVLEFLDRSGRKIIADAEIGETSKPEQGKEVEVYYLPKDPHQFYIRGSAPFEVFVMPFVAIAIAFILYALVKTLSILY